MYDLTSAIAERVQRIFSRGFHFKLIRSNPRDAWLVERMAADLVTGDVNISELIRCLLFDYYRQREATGSTLPALMAPGYLIPSQLSQPRALPEPKPVEEEFERFDDPLVMSFLNPGFDELESTRRSANSA